VDEASCLVLHVARADPFPQRRAEKQSRSPAFSFASQARMPASSRQLSARWPFWLLIAAWVCANSPQAATYAVLTWLAEARSFAHQQRLTVEVAFLLAGEKAPERVTRTETSAPARPPPAVPSEAVLKKLPLAMECAPESPFPRRDSTPLRAGAIQFVDTERPPPLLGPPRTMTG
jgi:hypothetical protein